MTATVFDLGEIHKIETEEKVEPVAGPVPNDQQRQAIEAPVDSAVRVLAGPGAGKTFVVARRYAYLLQNGATPADIIAVTFNKNMADELLARIIKVNPDVVGTSAEKQVCTIQALCYRLLRSEGDRRQVAKEWQVKRFTQEIAEDIWPYAENRPGYKEILSWVNSAKMKGLTTVDDLEYFSQCVDKFGQDVGQKLHEARNRFDAQMQREGLLMFADMPLDIETKLRIDGAFREKWQAKYQWLIIDESQDTTAQAMRILTTLAEPQDQAFLVGDADQLLYRFAGATPEANLYDGFEKRYPEGLLMKLEINYRSTQTIVDTQLRLIANNYSDAGGPYDQKYAKVLRPREDADEGEPVTFAEHILPENEAAALMGSIVEDLANGSHPGQIFIGARTRAQLGYLEGPLVRAKVPFINIANPKGFWGSKHVQDVIGYLRLAYSESDNEAFKQVFNVASDWSTHPWGEHKGEYCHHRYLGRAFLSACDERYSNAWKAVQSKRSFTPGVTDLTNFVQEMQVELSAGESARGVIEFIVDHCYEKYLAAEEGITAEDEAENGKLDDLVTVADVASQFNDVGEFLEYVADAVKAAEDARSKDWSDYVVLSTIHRLKGLEREIVYGVGLSEGVSANGSPAGLLPHTFSMSAPPQDGVLPTGGMGRIEDELCICFVLVSRAKERCHLSGVRKYRESVMTASRFIGMMGLGNDDQAV